METTAHGITETLANLSVAWILGIVAGLTVLRLAFVKLPNPLSRSVAEFLESALIAIALVFLVIRPFFVQANFIPSPSMVPTLLGLDNVGDKIIVNKLKYRLKEPQRDDVVVFLAPKETGMEDQEFIKRLIGKPGDRLEVVGGRLLIDGTLYSHSTLREKLAMAGKFGPEAVSADPMTLIAEHHVKFVPDGVLADGKLIPKQEMAQLMTGMSDATVVVKPGYTLRNGVRLNEPFVAEDPDYDMKLYQGRSLKHWLDPGNVPYKLNDQELTKDVYDAYNASPAGALPPGRLFMMGDNRNDSSDGTAWGTLDAHRVVGKAEFVFWPKPGTGFNRVGVIH